MVTQWRCFHRDEQKQALVDAQEEVYLVFPETNNEEDHYHDVAVSLLVAEQAVKIQVRTGILFDNFLHFFW